MRPRSVGFTNRLLITGFATLLFLAALVPCASAGPPFITDDPEPVEYRHGEFYTSLIYSDNKDGQDGTLPHFEFNYGIIPDVQLHLLFPMAYAHSKGGPSAYGPGDTEVGVKYRFIHESDTMPQVGIFPIVHVPTGDSERDLGSGHVPVFLPLWAQKSWGPWTTYGGGGYWINPGAGNRNFWQAGWLLQREIVKSLTLGAEIFYFSKDTQEGGEVVGYNIGGIWDLSEQHHILFSAGDDIAGDREAHAHWRRFSAYLGYQWTFGPPGEGKK